MDQELKPCPFCGTKPELVPTVYNPCRYDVQCPAEDCPTNDIWETKAEAIEAWNRRADGWIAVSERLPETSGRYLVYTIAPEGWVGDWATTAFWVFINKEEREWILDYTGSLPSIKPIVTHWQPLPAAPKAGPV